MTGETETTDGRAIETISIHFDLPGHRIPLSTFVRTAEQTEAVIQSLNRELFEGKLKFELFILPPEDGSFISKLGIVIFGGLTILWGFTESDIGKAFIKGLTLHEPAHWAELVGEELRETLIDGTEASPLETDEPDEDAKYQISARIVAEAAKSFLQTDLSELEQVGITRTRFRDAFDARNKFYEACMQTPDLSAIGFEDTPRFPIDRSNFSRLQVFLPPKEEYEDDFWLTGIAILKVTSPNWDREDRQRQWKGKDLKGRERFFRIDDEHFWTLVHAEQLSIHIIDTIQVQWAFRGIADNPKAIRVLRVLKFNDKALAEPLDDNALRAILGRYAPSSDAQGDLFKR